MKYATKEEFLLAANGIFDKVDWAAVWDKLKPYLANALLLLVQVNHTVQNWKY